MLRDNLVVLITCGDAAIEVPLEVTEALELGAALVVTAVEVARQRASARSGAQAAIESAMEAATEPEKAP
jgi:thiazole synthase ThiGH ThiG subunit